jgi:hypothetical protein
MGGLGNQLFQIFTTIAYSLEHKTPFVFAYSKMLNERKTYWDDFLSPLKKFTTDLNRIEKHYSKKMLLYEEHAFYYTEIPSMPYLKIQGYFQSHKYFEKHQSEIFSLIQLKEKQALIKRDFSHYLPKNMTTVSIHFRLGDYKYKQYYHPVLPFSYYANAIQQLTMKIDQPLSFLYFCEKEDNEYVYSVIERLRAIYPLSTFTKVNDEIEDWKQLLIMSVCNHQIIANSSFSWFSGYLNDNPNKLIYYPSLWFGPGLAHHNLMDLFPESWNCVEL